MVDADETGVEVGSGWLDRPSAAEVVMCVCCEVLAGGVLTLLDCGPLGGVTVVGVEPTEVGDGDVVVDGTCDVVDAGPGGVAGSWGFADGSTASATATTATVASPEPTTAMVRRRDRTAGRLTANDHSDPGSHGLTALDQVGRRGGSRRRPLRVQSGESRPQVVFANHHTSSLR